MREGGIVETSWLGFTERFVACVTWWHGCEGTSLVADLKKKSTACGLLFCRNWGETASYVGWLAGGGQSSKPFEIPSSGAEGERVYSCSPAQTWRAVKETWCARGPDLRPTAHPQPRRPKRGSWGREGELSAWPGWSPVTAPRSFSIIMSPPRTTTTTRRSWSTARRSNTSAATAEEPSRWTVRRFRLLWEQEEEEYSCFLNDCAHRFLPAGGGRGQRTDQIPVLNLFCFTVRLTKADAVWKPLLSLLRCHGAVVWLELHCKRMISSPVFVLLPCLHRESRSSGHSTHGSL